MSPGSPDSPESTDEQLVAAALRGDRDAFGDLVGRYEGRLVNYLYRLVRSSEDAHDLAQEVFLKVYQALDRFDPQYRFSTWLFRVAQNAAIDVLRKRRVQLVPISRREDASGEPAPDFDLPSDDPTPLAELEGAERDSEVRRAIDALPWEYRELILLRHYGELAYEEIADLKQMPLGTVKNKLFRARQMLKQHLAPGEPN